MKILLLLGMMCLVLLSQDIEIEADSFVMEDAKGIAKAKGNVVITKGQDSLHAKEVILILKDKKPTEYIATGEVRFRTITKEGKEIDGSANKVVYIVNEETYKLYSNAVIREKIKNQNKENIIKGEEISVAKNDGSANVAGSKDKPAKIIFSLDKENK